MHQYQSNKNGIAFIATSSVKKRQHRYLQTQTSKSINYNQQNNNIQFIHKRLLSSSSSSSKPSSSIPILSSPFKSFKNQQNISTNVVVINKSYKRKNNASTKYFTTKANKLINDPTSQTNTTVETQIAELRSEIANLSYLIKQSSIQQNETQSLSRRAEARAYIIEQKLMDIQRHVVKIPAVMEQLPNKLRQYWKEKSPTYITDALKKVSNGSDEGARAMELLVNKYTLWALLGSVLLFWRYRRNMYQRTSEEVANVAALTLQQDSLRSTIQETLSAVANSPETLAELSVLFRNLVAEETDPSVTSWI